mgnify:CR=1 FL=1
MQPDEHSIEYIQKDLDGIWGEIKIIRTELDNRVKYQHFTWVLGLLMAIVIGLLGVIYVQVKETSTAVIKMQEQVTLIQYRLDSAEITK